MSMIHTLQNMLLHAIAINIFDNKIILDDNSYKLQYTKLATALIGIIGQTEPGKSKTDMQSLILEGV